jgi:hypothetical protein
MSPDLTFVYGGRRYWGYSREVVLSRRLGAAVLRLRAAGRGDEEIERVVFAGSRAIGRKYPLLIEREPPTPPA